MLRWKRFGPARAAFPTFRDLRVRAHKTLDLLQSAIGVFKIEDRISRPPYIAEKREASDVLLPRQSPWEHGGGLLSGTIRLLNACRRRLACVILDVPGIC